MSHFVVMVVGLGIDEQLLPYKEYDGEKELLNEFIEFVDVEEESRKNYETKSIEKIKLNDGSFADIYDEKFKIHDNPQKPFPMTKSKYKYPEDSIKVQIPFNKFYSTFEEYMEKYEHNKKDEELNKYGYWTNTNSKWDWWVIGGKWDNYFKLKINENDNLNEFLDNIFDKNYTNQAKKKDIDFKGMEKNSINYAEKQFELIERITENFPIPLSWVEWVNKYGNEKLSRDSFRNQPWIKAYFESDEKELNKFLLCPIEYYCLKTGGKEKFIESEKQSSYRPYAFVKDGNWFELSSNEKSDWNEEFNSLLNSVDDEEVLTIVDCHI